MVEHFTFALQARQRGFHLITSEVLSSIPNLPKTGLFTIFIHHTSAGICINENADPDVLHDFELYFNTMVKENLPGMKHTIEGPDDMPAHIKAVLTGSSVQIPIQNHRLMLGTWQGIYLAEFRNRARERNITVSIYN